VNVLFFDEPIRLDGVLDDWPVDRVTVDNVVYGRRDWSGENDLWGRALFGWDDDYLYVGARVRDDRYVQNESGEDIFLGDSLEILLDTNVSDDYYKEVLDGDDYQLGISPGSPEPGDDPEAYLWYPSAVDDSDLDVRIVAERTDEGYRLEAAIPWEVFDVDPTSGRHFGFAFAVSDNDLADDDVQQSMVSNVSGRNLADPTTWGDLVLSANRAPRPSPTQRSVDRSSANVQVARAGTPPVIDGSLGEWGASRYPISTVVFGSNRWDNENDLSGSLMSSWDTSALYLAVQVNDERYAQNQTGENIFLGDHIEILFDANLQGDLRDTRLSLDDFQLGISPGRGTVGTNEEAYLWYPDIWKGNYTNISVAAASTNNGYVVEIAIPWTFFGVSASSGQEYGFAFSISDNDSTDSAAQHSMVSNLSRRDFTNPATWGSLTLYP
jgi:hypothetical protein